jgi:hypothetical protein
MPLVWNLTAEIKASLGRLNVHTLNDRWRAHGAGHPTEVIESLEKILAMPEVHYESVLGYLELQYLRGGGRGFAQDYHGLYSWLIDTVSSALLLRHLRQVEFIEGGMKHYEGMVTLAEDNPPLWIFSLNHDVLVECIAAHHGIPLSSGFPGEITLPRRNRAGRQVGLLHADVATGEQIEKSALSFFGIGARGINLLKTHGALDIFAFRNGEDLMKIRPLAASVRGVVDALRVANQELLYVDPANGLIPFQPTNEIVYTDHDGQAQFLRRSLMAGAFKFTDRYKQVLPKRLLSHLRSNLNHLARLICVGYSFGDIHINQVLRDWIDFSDTRTITIVSPAPEIPSFLAHVPLQTTVVAASATAYFEQLLKTPPPVSQKVERCFRALTREAQGKAVGFA